MSTIAGITVTFGLPENDTRQQNASLGQAQDLTWKYFNYGASSRVISIPLHGLTTVIKDALATALESQKANAITLVAGGLTYNLNDILSSTTGTYPVKVKVTAINGAPGAVVGLSLYDKGSGITTGTKATTGGGNNACTFSVDSLTDQLTIAPDSHIDLGAGAGIPITAQWIDPSFNFTKSSHDAWFGTLTFMRVV